MPSIDDIFADLPGAQQPSPAPRTIDDIFMDGSPRHGQTRRNAAGQLEIGVGGTSDAPQAPPAPQTAGVSPQTFGLPNWGDVKRQVGLSLRAPVQAGAELMGLIGDPLAAGYNLLTGRGVEPPSRQYERGLDNVFPTPETPTEQFANRVATAGWGAMGSMGLAGAAQPTTAVGRGVQQALTTNPLGQVVGAGSGAGAGELTRQAGYPWWAQLAANLIAAPLGGAAANRTADWVRETSNMRDAVSRAGPTATKDAILDQGARRVVQQVGANWDDLSESVRRGLREQVEQSIRTGAPIDPVRAQRLIAFQQLGTQPTNAMLTRNPQDWAQEDRLRGIPGVGEPLNQAHENAGNAVRDALTARGQPGDTRTGREIAGGLDAIKRQLASQRSAAYTAARNSPEGMQGVPVNDFRAFLNSRQTRAGTQPQYRTAMEELERLSAGNPSMTQNNWEELRKSVNAMRNPMDAPSMNATNEIRGAMDDAFAGAGRSPAFADARFAQQLYRSTTADQGMVDKLTRMVTNVDRKVPYADVFDTLVKADPAALKQVKNTLVVGGQGRRWETMKARTMEELASTLNLASSTENRGATFLRKMDNLAEQLPVIFEPEELARLQAARQVVENAMTAPRGTMKFSNPSGTAAQMIGHASDILRASGPTGNRVLAGIPGAVRRGIQGVQNRGAAEDALRPSILSGLPGGQPMTTPWITPQLLSLVYGGGLRAPAEDPARDRP